MAALSALFIAASVATATPPKPPIPAVHAEARVSVRIVRAARITFEDRGRPPPSARATRATVTLEDGRRQPAHLIEFE